MSNSTWAVSGGIEFVSIIVRHPSPLAELNLSWGLYSITWEDTGNSLRTGCLSLREFRAYFSRGPVSLREIQIAKLRIVDHLGEILSVPMIFCSSWKVCPLLSCILALGHFGQLGIGLYY
jgi:hypothetical protein